MPEFDTLAAQAATELKSRLQLASVPGAYVQLGHEFPHEAVEVGGVVSLRELDGLPDSDSLASAPDLGLLGCGGRPILVGRSHRYLYEGHGMDSVLLPLAAAIQCGVEDVVLVETCLSLRDDLRVGSWFMATDYISNLGQSPLHGRLGSVACPFQDMTDAFSQSLNAEVVNHVSERCTSPRLGVYQADVGPHYPTPSEADAARRNGADVIGNAIVPEAILAAALGCRVTALLLVVGHAATYRGKRHRHSDTLDAAEFCGPPMLHALFAALSEEEEPVPATESGLG